MGKNDDKVFDDNLVNPKDNLGQNQVEIQPKGNEPKRANELVIQMDSNSFFNTSSIKDKYS
jgi:hypothetical protein